MASEPETRALSVAEIRAQLAALADEAETRVYKRATHPHGAPELATALNPRHVLVPSTAGEARRPRQTSDEPRPGRRLPWSDRGRGPRSWLASRVRVGRMKWWLSLCVAGGSMLLATLAARGSSTRASSATLPTDPHPQFDWVAQAAASPDSHAATAHAETAHAYELPAKGPLPAPSPSSPPPPRVATAGGSSRAPLVCVAEASAAVQALSDGDRQRALYAYRALQRTDGAGRCYAEIVRLLERELRCGVEGNTCPRGA